MSVIAGVGYCTPLLYISVVADRPLTRSFHALRPTAAFPLRPRFLVVLVPLDIHGFRSVLARGWHGGVTSTRASFARVEVGQVIFVPNAAPPARSEWATDTMAACARSWLYSPAVLGGCR